MVTCESWKPIPTPGVKEVVYTSLKMSFLKHLNNSRPEVNSWLLKIKGNPVKTRTFKVDSEN